MAFRSARLTLALGLLVGAAGGSEGQMQPATPMQGQHGQPGTAMQGQPAGGQALHLGRTFPRQLPPPPPRKSPQVYVSIVSPRQSSNVFQHIGQQGSSNGGRGTGGMGSAGGMGNGGMSGGFPAR